MEGTCDECLHPSPTAGHQRLDQSLVEAARELDINLSCACEEGLAREIKSVREARWREENAEAIASWNDYVRKNGLPLAKYRRF